VNLGANPHATQLPLRPLSEALAVYNRGARLIVLALGDPHLLECTQRGQDGASNPHRVLALRWCDHFDLHGGWRKGCELLGHPLTNTSEHRRAARQHNVGIKVFSDINVAFHDRLEGGVMYATGFLSDEAWLEEHLRASEALAADGDDVAIWQLVCLLLVGRLSGGLHLCVVIERNVGQLLLHITDDFTLGRGGERVASLSEDPSCTL